ncbi:MAG: CBS domain-containing protein [Myxococcota bacterium]
MYEFLEYCVEDVMQSRVVTIGPDATLADAETVFEDHQWNGLPVVAEGGRLVGMLTKLDLLAAFRFTDAHMFPPYADIMKRPVRDVMSADAQTVTPRAKLTDVLEKMVQSRRKSFPVVDGDELVGIVAREDVMGALRRAASGKRPAALEGEAPAR